MSSGSGDSGTAVRLSSDDAIVILANLTHPRQRWLRGYERAVDKGDHFKADYCLEHLLRFDALIDRVRAVLQSGGTGTDENGDGDVPRVS